MYREVDERIRIVRELQGMSGRYAVLRTSLKDVAPNHGALCSIDSMYNLYRQLACAQSFVPSSMVCQTTLGKLWRAIWHGIRLGCSVTGC